MSKLTWTISAAHALQVVPGTRLDIEFERSGSGRATFRTPADLAQQARDAVMGPITAVARQAVGQLPEIADLAEAGQRLAAANALLSELREKLASLAVRRNDPDLWRLPDCGARIRALDDEVAAAEDQVRSQEVATVHVEQAIGRLQDSIRQHVRGQVAKLAREAFAAADKRRKAALQQLAAVAGEALTECALAEFMLSTAARQDELIADVVSALVGKVAGAELVFAGGRLTAATVSGQ